MPGLVMFGRRWGFGSDDLVVTTVVVAVLHAVWYDTLRHSTYISVLLIYLTASCRKWSVVVVMETSCGFV